MQLSRAMCTGVNQDDVVSHRHRAMRMSHVSRQCTWRDSFMSHANQTSVTQRGQILKISFGLIHFLIFFKRTKIQKNVTVVDRPCTRELGCRIRRAFNFVLIVNPFWRITHC
jgi:hypothetical protein